MSKVRVTKLRSTIGQNIRVVRSMEALGLNKINSFNELELTPQIKGILHKVNHLVKIENI
ncbi:MAG: 50S ribosomal protein L30 [Bacteroidota bacterium]|jgi:large subunit ribosomal protein L30|nr:50S ribosomal protein L30 [Bacteroidota bacterium]